MAPRSRQLSSTPLEILLFLNGWYYATYFLLEIFIFVYKGLLLPYPSANLALDLVMLFLYLGIEVTRIFFGWTHTKAPSRLFQARQGDALPQRLGLRPHIPSLHGWSDGGVSAPRSRARPSHSLIPHQPLLGRKPPLACPATWRETLTRIPDLAPHEAAIPCAQASLTRCRHCPPLPAGQWGWGGRGCWELTWIPFRPLQPGLRVCPSPCTQGQVAPGPDRTPMDHACTFCILPFQHRGGGADTQGPPCKY
ncbi:transmembrane protein 216 isoform X1 [Terrapene carolina triunguis]|uniref:transmembrane protein 216 isoform X1 n=1 Tax=Terrapene triunguis TaxID=2587831 RepID=UPI000CEFA2F2|nr:transmembrane protein 216 isoform X1 [Terrapene carolina triunguis]